MQWVYIKGYRVFSTLENGLVGATTPHPPMGLPTHPPFFCYGINFQQPLVQFMFLKEKRSKLGRSESLDLILYLGKVLRLFPTLLSSMVNMDHMGGLLLGDRLRLEGLRLHPKLSFVLGIPVLRRELLPSSPRCWCPRRWQCCRGWRGCRCRGCRHAVHKLWLEDGLVDAGEGGLEGEVKTQACRH